MEILETHKGRRIDAERTICEVHRTIADLLVCNLKDRPELLREILPHLNDAYKMGIRLVLALIEKKIALPAWDRTDIERARQLRTERNRLVKVLNETGCCL